MVINIHNLGPIYPILIPTRPSIGCPKGTIDGFTTCFCEDHCSWNVCRLKNPPTTCPGAEIWKWNSLNMYWVAQGKRIAEIFINLTPLKHTVDIYDFNNTLVILHVYYYR